jgi:hypothetical protein
MGAQIKAQHGDAWWFWWHREVQNAYWRWNESQIPFP